MELFQQADSVMATDIVLSLVAQNSTVAQELFTDLWLQIHRFDERFSRFRHDSEVTVLNQHAGEWVQVSAAFKALLLTTKQMAEATGGLFNPFVLPALQRAGYVASFTPTAATATPPDYSDRRVAAIDELELDGDRVRIPAKTALDLGGIGKGYLLDELGARLRRQGCENFWLSLGGDILVSGSAPHEEPWDIAIASAQHPSQIQAVVTPPTSHCYAVATSGIIKRAGTHRGKKWHHLIDPSTGEPAATDILMASVVMPTATMADVYASCVVSLGSQHYAEFVKQHMIEAVLVQTKNGAETKGRGIALYA